MATPLFVRADIWSDLACFGGTRQCFVGDIVTLTTTRTVDNRDALTLVVGRTNRAAAFLVKLAVIRLVFSDTTYDEEWRITGIEQDQVSGQITVTADWPLIDLSTRALLCSTPALVTDDQAPYAFEAVGLTPAQHWDNYVSRGFPSAWSGKVGRGTFDVNTPQDLVYDWDKPRKIIGDLAKLTNTEISYRRNGSTSYLLDLLTAIGSSAPVLDVRLGKNLLGVTVTEDENQRATTVFPRSALVDGVSYGLAQNRWQIAAMNAGAKTIDLVDPAGKAGPIAFDHQFGTTGLAWRVFKANGPPVSASNRIITDSAVANQRLTVSVDPTLIFSVGDWLCFGTVDGSGNYAPVWSLNDGPQAIVDPPVAVLKRDDVVAGINLVPNPVMRTWSGGAGTAPDSWIKAGACTLSKRTSAADYQSGGQALRVQSTANGQGVYTALQNVTPTSGQPYFTAFAKFRIDALTGGAKVQCILWAESFISPVIVKIYPNTWGAAQSAADSDQIGVWVTIAISVPLLAGVGSCTLTAERLQLQIVQEGSGTADFTIDSAQITQTSYQLPLIEGASGNVLWQAANEQIAATRGAQREYRVQLADLASSDPAAFPYDQIQLGQTFRVTDADIGVSAVLLRCLLLTRKHITGGQLTPADVEVNVGLVPPSASGLIAGSALSGRQGTVSGVAGAGSRTGNAPVLPPDFSTSAVLGFFDIRDYGAAAGAALASQHAQINNAIIAANAAGGGVVYIPPGVWMVDPDKAAGNSVRLLDNVALWIPAGAILRATATTIDTYAVVYALGLSNIAVFGEGTIDGNRAGHTGVIGESGMALWIAGCDGVHVRDVHCINGWGDGVYLGDNGTTPNTNVDISGVICDGNRRNGMSVVGVKGGTITHCQFLNTSGTAPQAGIDLEPNNAGNVDGVIVSDCVSLDNAGAGFVLTTSSRNCTLHHNYVARSAKNGFTISATGDGNQVSHNTVADLTASTRGAFDVGSGTVGCRLIGNIARNIETGFAAFYVHSTAAGIELRHNRVKGHNLSAAANDAFTIAAPSVVLEGNIVEDSGGIGIDVSSGADRCQLLNNTVIRSVGRGFYLAGANLQVVGNQAIDVGTVSGAMFQFPATGAGAQAMGNRAILTTPNAAIVPFLFTGAATFKLGNIAIGTAAYTEVLDKSFVPLMGAAEALIKILNVAGEVTGASQYGLEVELHTDATATANGIAAYLRSVTNASAYTQALAAGAYFDSHVKGAGSTITKAVGAYFKKQTGGATNWAFETEADADAQVGGQFTAKRLKGIGTAHVASDYAASAGFGSSASVSVTGARDTGGRVSVASAGTGQAANPTLVLTFKDGTWTTAPAVTCSRGDTLATAGRWAVSAVTATTVTFTFVGTPVAGETYVIDFTVVGK